MNKGYRVNDLYIAAYLGAKGYTYKIEQVSGKKCEFLFDEIGVKEEVLQFMNNSNIIEFNVNGMLFISEIKKLKSYIHNLG